MGDTLQVLKSKSYRRQKIHVWLLKNNFLISKPNQNETRHCKQGRKKTVGKSCTLFHRLVVYFPKNTFKSVKKNNSHNLNRKIGK